MLLHQSGYASLPAADSLEELTSRFQAFFTEKVSHIYSSMAHTDEVMVHPEQPVTLPHGCSLDSFRLTTITEVKKLLSKAPAKSLELDPVPIWLLTKCGNELAPVLVDIINRSLESGVVPGSFKLAHVQPLLKRSGLDTKKPETLQTQTSVQLVLSVQGNQIKGWFPHDWQNTWRALICTTLTSLPTGLFTVMRPN